MQIEANAAQVERQHHRKAANKQAQSKNALLLKFKPRIHPFACLCHNTALDSTKLGRCAAWLSRYAGAFLDVFSGVLIQLHFDDIWCFCCVAASCARALFAPLDFDTAAANPCLAWQIISRRFASNIHSLANAVQKVSPKEGHSD